MTNYEDFMNPDWIASDHHLGHINILKFEPDQRGHYASINHMNADIVARHNEQVTDDNAVVIFLGDLAMGDLETSLTYVASMRGKKGIVPGNHDRLHPLMTKNPERLAEFSLLYEQAGLTILPREMEISLDGRSALISHYPYQGVVDGGIVERDKHEKWRPVPQDKPLIHGHIHLHRRERDNMFNVGIGVNDLAPVHKSVLIDWIDGLPVKKRK